MKEGEVKKNNLDADYSALMIKVDDLCSHLCNKRISTEYEGDETEYDAHSVFV